MDGKVESGSPPQQNKKLDLLGNKKSVLKVALDRVMKCEKSDTCQDEFITALLHHNHKDDCERGNVLVAPGTTKISSDFEASVNIFESDEGGRRFPFKTNYKLQVNS